MRQSSFLLMLLVLLFWAGMGMAQPGMAPPATLSSAPHALAAVFLHGPAGTQDDPASAAYKAGYALVLNEEWEQARKKFEEVISRYPKSHYVDDAQYWSAYAMTRIDKKKASAAYRAFISRHPTSRYYEDAVADLAELEMLVTLTAPKAPHVQVVTEEGKVVTVNVQPSMQKLQRALQRQARAYGRYGLAREYTRWNLRTAEEIDKRTMLKMEALYALGETKEDGQSFATLKEVALDPAQPRALREAAMEALSHSTKYDVIPVFLEIARKDTNLQLQGYAIDFIGEHGKDKNQTVTILIELFQSIPSSRKGQRESIFFTIADIGNEKAVGFLRDIALTHDDYELRRDAIYYLGSIGGETARQALYEVLRSN